MALKLAIETFGKRDGIGFRPSDLIPHFGAFTGRAERTEEAIEAMVASLLLNGQEQNFVYRKGFGDVPIPISGHTRILAADRITQRGLTAIRFAADGTETKITFSPESPFIVYGTYKACNEVEALFHMFAENDDRTRTSLTGMDIAGFISAVESYGISDADIAKRLGKQASQISNYRKYLELDPATQAKVRSREINDATALALTKIDPKARSAAIEKAKAENNGKVTARGVAAAVIDSNNNGHAPRPTIKLVRGWVQTVADDTTESKAVREFAKKLLAMIAGDKAAAEAKA